MSNLLYSPFILVLLIASCGVKFNTESPTKPLIRLEWVYQAEMATHRLNFLVDPAEFTSPKLDGSRVYVGLSQGKRLIAIDQSSGEVVWEHPMQARIEKGLTIQDDYVIVGDIQGKLDVLYKQDGLLKWTKSIGEPIMAAFTCDSQRILVATASDHLLALNINDGNILWEYKRKTIQRQTIAGAFSPLVMDGAVYVGFSDGYLLAFDHGTGQKLWEVKVIESDHLTDLDIYGISSGDHLYISSPLPSL